MVLLGSACRVKTTGRSFTVARQYFCSSPVCVKGSKKRISRAVSPQSPSRRMVHTGVSGTETSIASSTRIALRFCRFVTSLLTLSSSAPVRTGATTVHGASALILDKRSGFSSFVVVMVMLLSKSWSICTGYGSRRDSRPSLKTLRIFPLTT